MIVKITSKRQVTFPKRVLDELGVGPGDRLELLEGPDGFALRPKRTDYSKLGPSETRLSLELRLSTSASLGMRDMIRQRIGIDTSILVLLVTGAPPDIHAYCLDRLGELVAERYLPAKISQYRTR